MQHNSFNNVFRIVYQRNGEKKIFSKVYNYRGSAFNMIKRLRAEGGSNFSIQKANNWMEEVV